MALKSRFNRGIVLMVIAVSAGMFAQEQISRFSMAGDQPAALASASNRSWQSAESFYQGHPGIYRVESVSVLAEPATEDLVESTSGEAPVEAFVARIEAQPEPLASEEPVVLEEPVSIAAHSPDEGMSAATNGAEASSTDGLMVQDTFRVAMVEEPPVIERRPATIPPLDQRELPELPPPATSSPDLDRVDPELLLPPWQRTSGRTRADVAESALDRHHLPTFAPSAHSDVTRYIDPAELVRQRGIERGQQLQRRLEARRLLGYSPLRPPVQASPFTSSDAFRPVVVLLPRTVVVQQEPSGSGR
jgi:hypothetical protein